MNKVIVGETTLALINILSKENPKSILIITGKNSYKNSKAEIFFKKIDSEYFTNIYHKIEENSSYFEILDLLKKYEEISFDIIIAYGGGSVIDFSKVVSLYKKNIIRFRKNFQNSESLSNTIPLIAIPTTAGSGAESTQFAVLYKENIKYSIVNKNIIPKYAILDSKSTFSLSKYQTACSAIDAVCQAIESLWAKNKNEKSEQYALKALQLIYPNIIKCYEGVKESRLPVLEGSNFSGKAINISMTTAPHALSYYLTCFHNIPHGEAVAINIEPFIKINFESISETAKIKLLKIFKVKTKDEFIKSMSSLKLNLGLKLNLSEVKGLNPRNYLSKINIERLKNNPIKLSSKELLKIIKR